MALNQPGGLKQLVEKSTPCAIQKVHFEHGNLFIKIEFTNGEAMYNTV
jgi:hypothetical protein